MKYFLLLLCSVLLFACSAPRKAVLASEDAVEYSRVGLGGFNDGYSEYGSGGISGMHDGFLDSPGAVVTNARGSIMAKNSATFFDYQNSQNKRMVDYNGDITLEAPEPEIAIDSAIQIVKNRGGSFEARSSGFVRLKVPVKEFRDIFNKLLSLGAVIEKEISANDITEQYADNNSRLRIAQTSLARYKELLALAKTEQEKLSLLKEIQRLSEIIEQREILEKDFLRRAAFSTIRLKVRNAPKPKPIPHISENLIAFRWFWDLPDERTIIGKAVKLSVPKDFIETKNTKKCWRAASTLNAEFWAFETPRNNPQGDVNFWADAVQNFFKNKYKTELIKTENYSLIRLQTADAEPRVFYIAVLKSTDEKHLRIAEAYFPNLNAEKKHSEAVKEVLGGVK